MYSTVLLARSIPLNLESDVIYIDTYKERDRYIFNVVMKETVCSKILSFW